MYDFGVMYLDTGLITAGIVTAAAAVALAAQMLVGKSSQPKKVKVPVRARTNKKKNK